MSRLFETENYITAKEKASREFSESFTKMTDEIERVSSEKVTIWGLLVTWIYDKIFGRADHIKEKQSTMDLYRSAEAFDKVESIFRPEPSRSMNNEQIMHHTKENFEK